MRAHNRSSEHGITLDFLERKWEEDGGWSYCVEPSIVNGKVLVKTQSIESMDMDTKLHARESVRTHKCQHPLNYRSDVPPGPFPTRFLNIVM